LKKAGLREAVLGRADAGTDSSAHAPLDCKPRNSLIMAWDREVRPLDEAAASPDGLRHPFIAGVRKAHAEFCEKWDESRLVHFNLELSV